MPHDIDIDNFESYESHGLLRSAKFTLFGATVPFVIRNPSGDWTAYLPDGQKQADPNETWSCVSHSAINSIETQEFFLTGKKIKYSKRWLAKLSGTTNQGNYLTTVAQTVMNYGLVLESSWPAPTGLTFSQYYAEPSPVERQILVAEGAKWLKTHKIQSDWTSPSKEDILQYLKQCPLQVTVPGHAIENYALNSPQDVVNYLDSYDPFKKQINRSNLFDVYKIILTMKLMRLVNDNGTYYLVGDKGKIGLADMGALNDIKDIESIEEIGDTTGIPQVGIFETGLTYHK